MAVASALHHNKAKTNLHIHLIFSERQELDVPERKIAERNLFYDENRKNTSGRRKRFWMNVERFGRDAGSLRREKFMKPIFSNRKPEIQVQEVHGRNEILLYGSYQ